MTRLEKQRNIVDFTLSSLWRRKGKNIALILVYTLIVASIGSVILFSQAIEREATLVLQETPEIVVQRLVAGRHDLIPTEYGDKISGIRGVRALRTRLWGYYYDSSSGANFTFMVSPNLQLEAEEIAIGNGIARCLTTVAGDLMSFRAFDGETLSFQIKGVFSRESELISADLIMVTEDDFRRLFGVSKGYATDLIIEVSNKKEITTIARKITEILPDTRPILRDEILRTYETVFHWRAGLLFAISTGALLAFIVLAWDKATGLSAEEKREIGILKGLGWETSDVLIMKFWEGLIISLVSFLTGILVAYFHVFFASLSAFEPILKGWSILYPDFRLTPYIDFFEIVTMFFLTVVPYTVTTIIPSWRAATVDPDTAMRGNQS